MNRASEKKLISKEINAAGSGSKDMILRNRIYVYSFILTVLVIWIHSPSLAVFDYDKLIQGSNMLYRNIQALILKIAGAAVPGFFLLSGYQFFRDLREEKIAYTVEAEDCCGIRSRKMHIAYGIIASKLMRRVKTLLLPYLLWNLIYFAMNIVAKGEILSLGNLFEAIVYYKYNPVFWYMHQLIRISILTPLLYPLIRYKRTAILSLSLFFIAAVKYDVLPFHFANEDAIFYYVAGAVIVLHWDFISNELSDVNRRKKQLLVVCCNLMAVVILFFVSDIAFESNILFFNPHELMIMFLILFRISTALLVMNLIMLVDLSRFKARDIFKISFFIYAIHPIEIKLAKIAQTLAGLNENVVITFVLFMLMPVICYAVSYLVYRFMKRYMNRFYLMLSGGR
ncbi:MAG: acyltransferase [Eubacteriales bacterium]|nr:acyltransferase [Eubacteriales bacterium]